MVGMFMYISMYSKITSYPLFNPLSAQQEIFKKKINK